MKEEKGKWEELIRSKIYDFEVDTNPDDWDALAAKLDGGKKIRLIPYQKYIYRVSAAAVIALLIVGGLYLFSDKDDGKDTQAAVEITSPQMDNAIPDKNDNNVNQINNLVAVAKIQDKKPVIAKFDTKDEPSVKFEPSAEEENVQAYQPEADEDFRPLEKDSPEDLQEIISAEQPYLAAVSPEVKHHRRWGFGVGGGSYAIGSTTGNDVGTASRRLSDEELLYAKSAVTTRSSSQGASLFDPVEEYKINNNIGKIKHLKPLSGGLGVSYYLTDRWALQSGVVYTLLRSKKDKNYDADGITDWKQNLHFIGIPFSVSYKIGDWKRLRFYATAGGMGELNIAGQQKTTIIVEGIESIITENVRMKEPLWSVNTRAGAVYPLWKFINFYAEAGVSYYFDNKSSIETIRSDKPFNVSLQAGLRLGF